MQSTNQAQPEPGAGKAVVESFKFKNRVYELRRNSCGKPNCSTCHGNIPRHGPYWYLCVPWGGRWRRIYIGKDLDTTKFIGPDGKIDHSKMGKGSHRPVTALCPDNEYSNLGTTDQPSGSGQLDALAESGQSPDCVIDDLPDGLHVEDVDVASGRPTALEGSGQIPNSAIDKLEDNLRHVAGVIASLNVAPDVDVASDRATADVDVASDRQAGLEETTQKPRGIPVNADHGIRAVLNDHKPRLNYDGFEINDDPAVKPNVVFEGKRNSKGNLVGQ